MKRDIFMAADGKKLSLCIWDDVESPKGVIQLTHGMSEFIARYDDFAKFLNSKGFIAAGFDSRCHGETDPEALGISDKPESDIFSNTVADMQNLNANLAIRYKLPIIVLGHSYGSLLLQEYIRRGGKGEAFVLVGSAFMNGLDLKFASWVANRSVKKGKAAEKGDFFAKLTFTAYDKKVNEGQSAWICTDKKIVDDYNDSPQCGFVCSNGFYASMFKGLIKLAKNDFHFANKSANILITSGAMDEFSRKAKLTKKLYENYQKHGFKNVQLKLYDGLRHEILNESSKQTVYEDILQFIEGCIV